MNESLRALAGKPVIKLPEPFERARLRNLFGVTQEQLAEALKVSRKTIWTWELGRKEPTGVNRERYAEMLALWAERERESQ